MKTACPQASGRSFICFENPSLNRDMHINTLSSICSEWKLCNGIQTVESRADFGISHRALPKRIYSDPVLPDLLLAFIFSMARASPSPSSSSSSSVTPPPTISVSSNKKKNAKNKPKKASKSVDAGKNEGADLNWAYVPPADTVRVGDEDVDAEEFDWETQKKDDDLELWLIRVPESVSRSTPMWYAKLSYFSRNAQIKPKHLDKVEVTFSASSQTACIGTLNRKYSSFDIWSMGEGDEQPVGGEEIKSLSCLLPRKGKKGRALPRYAAASPTALIFHAHLLAQNPSQ